MEKADHAVHKLYMCESHTLVVPMLIIENLPKVLIQYINYDL